MSARTVFLAFAGTLAITLIYSVAHAQDKTVWDGVYTEAQAKRGEAIWTDKCAKCHGSTGLGDGPDADPDHQEHMNLTNPKGADRNSDGVVFYKVSNGRRRPKMPAFKEELTEQQIWSVVGYVQTLRKK